MLIFCEHLLQKKTMSSAKTRTIIRVGQLKSFSGKLSRSCASSHCKPLAIMSHSSTSFPLFFGLFFCPFNFQALCLYWTLFFIHSVHKPLHIHSYNIQNLFKIFPCWSNPWCDSLLSSSFHTEYIAEVREPVFVSFGFTISCNHFATFNLKTKPKS